MSKRYSRSKRVYPKQKWSINAVNCNEVLTSCPSSNFVINGQAIVQNPSRVGSYASSATTPAAILKCGRFKVRGILSNVAGLRCSVIVYLIYVPMGITPTHAASSYSNLNTEALFYTHPEWVIAWTRMDYSSTEQRNEYSLTSTLKRNLNPGDSIYLCFMTINTGETATTNQQYQATVTYCCRNN